MKVCLVCGKELTAEQIKLNPGKGRERKYCSMACYNSTRHSTVTINCDYCGREYTTYLSKLPYEKHYCSRSCFEKKQSNLSNDLSKRSRTRKRRRYFRQFIKKIGGNCVLCGSGGNKYNWQVIIHHLTDICGDEEENLCPIHRSCHRTIERIKKHDSYFYKNTILPMLRDRIKLFLNNKVKK